MTQFDVYSNPIRQARKAYPLLVVLQSDLSRSARKVIVAPLVPLTSIPGVAGRLAPIVSVDGDPFAALVPALAGVDEADLGPPRCTLCEARDNLLAAVDYLFFGV